MDSKGSLGNVTSTSETTYKHHELCFRELIKQSWSVIRWVEVES